MSSSSGEMSLEQRVLTHLGTLRYGLRLLSRLPADTVLVAGYSDGHTTIAQVTLGQVEAMLVESMDQLKADARHWQQPASGADGAAPASPHGSGPS